MRTAVTSTSIDAYHLHRENGLSSRQRERILAFVERRGGDWSIGELAAALNMQKSTVSARVNELLNETGELEVRPKRKDRHSSITVRPVALPAQQMRLFS